MSTLTSAISHQDAITYDQSNVHDILNFQINQQQDSLFSIGKNIESFNINLRYVFPLLRPKPLIFYNLIDNSNKGMISYTIK